jgi:hypothetical protein
VQPFSCKVLSDESDAKAVQGGDEKRLGVIHSQAMLHVDLVGFLTAHKAPVTDSRSRRRRINYAFMRIEIARRRRNTSVAQVIG